MAQYVAKNPTSILKRCVPTTYPFQISFADELDELWSDELYDLGQRLDDPDPGVWILKPGLADRGQGIRLFRTREELVDILESFESRDDDDEELDTDVNLGSLRWWVAQVGRRCVCKRERLANTSSERSISLGRP